MLKRIGAEQSGEFKAVASGTLPSGKPVIVNADGTVSLPVSVTGGNGTPNTFSGGNNANHNGMSEVGNSKFVIAYPFRITTSIVFFTYLYFFSFMS